ncbi:uncharacterized protein DUF748 [Azonexus fungiphilus]|uniref:Uncharacterized protein DUF748 n=2 Tax=Azonexus fungiphilus TaxID=146940 RepID=A0A495WGR2_9RHOO|nr:uncharacterized protein DUF748 [Azonexus fungiphilus]
MPFFAKITMSDVSKSVLLKMSQLRGTLDTASNRRRGKWAAGIFAALVLFGFLALPPLLKPLLLEQLAAQLHREVAIERIDINPLTLSATVAGVSVRGEGGEVAGFDELYVNLSAASLFKLALVVDEIRLTGPRLAVTRIADGRYDVSDLLDQWLQPDDEPAQSPPRFSLNNIQIAGGRITFTDQPHAAVHRIEDLQLALPFVSSLPYQAEALVQPMFSASVNGSPLHLDGKTTPFADDRESELNLDLDGFDLGGLQAYLPDGFPLRLASARLDTRLRAVFRQLPGGVNSLVVAGSLGLEQLALARADGQPLVAWKSLAVEIEEADPFNRRVALRRVTLDGADLNLAVDRRGELNLLAVAGRLAGGKTPAAAPAKPAEPFVWSLAEFAMRDGRLRWRDESGPQPVLGEVAEIALRLGPLDQRLSQLELAEASASLAFGERLAAGKLALEGGRVDLASQRIDLAVLRLSGARLALSRNAAGAIEWLTPPQRAGQAAAKPAPAAKPWLAKAALLEVDDLGLKFADQSVSPAAVQQIDGFSLRGEGLGNIPGEKGTLAIKSTVNRQGKLEISGDVGAVPLVATLKVTTEAIPVNGLQGYSERFLNVLLQRGQFSSQGEASFSLDGDRLKAGYKGSATIGNLLAVDRENKADFLKWKSLYFGGIDFRLDPLAIDIREISLSDFFSRLILNQNGRLNIADIVRQPEAAPAPAPVAAAEAAAPMPAAPPVPIRIGKVTLNNGAVNFSDFFVKPNYTVNVGKLAGRIAGLSSTAGTTADMELRGTYGGAAPVLVTARLNPLAAQSFLDLQAEVKGIDLTGFSPYSGKYAGYLIDKGKLTLNVAYKLENRQLSADNRLFIDQLTFGERVDSPEATSLPVNLAISLLKNNRGEIDINLPISGSLDDPQFSVGGLIVKVIVNLFVKAVTSPFALLGSMFGGGEELSQIAFAPGRSQLDAAGLKKLEALARALNERAALKLEIAGFADPEIDRDGVKRVALERAMQREKLADLQKQGGEVDSAESLRLTPADYKIYLPRVYKAGKFPKPRNFVGLQKELPAEEMEKLLLANLPAADGDLALLARQRAEHVQAWLIEQGKVPAERIFLVPGKPAKDAAAGGRVDFSLR